MSFESCDVMSYAVRCYIIVVLCRGTGQYCGSYELGVVFICVPPHVQSKFDAATSTSTSTTTSTSTFSRSTLTVPATTTATTQQTRIRPSIPFIRHSAPILPCSLSSITLPFDITVDLDTLSYSIQEPRIRALRDTLPLAHARMQQQMVQAQGQVQAHASQMEQEFMAEAMGMSKKTDIDAYMDMAMDMNLLMNFGSLDADVDMDVASAARSRVFGPALAHELGMSADEVAMAIQLEQVAGVVMKEQVNTAKPTPRLLANQHPTQPRSAPTHRQITAAASTPSTASGVIIDLCTQDDDISMSMPATPTRPIRAVRSVLQSPASVVTSSSTSSPVSVASNNPTRATTRVTAAVKHYNIPTTASIATATATATIATASTSATISAAASSSAVVIAPASSSSSSSSHLTVVSTSSSSSSAGDRRALILLATEKRLASQTARTGRTRPSTSTSTVGMNADENQRGHEDRVKRQKTIHSTEGRGAGYSATRSSTVLVPVPIVDAVPIHSPLNLEIESLHFDMSDCIMNTTDPILAATSSASAQTTTAATSASKSAPAAPAAPALCIEFISWQWPTPESTPAPLTTATAPKPAPVVSSSSTDCIKATAGNESDDEIVFSAPSLSPSPPPAPVPVPESSIALTPARSACIADIRLLLTPSSIHALGRMQLIKHCTTQQLKQK